MDEGPGEEDADAATADTGSMGRVQSLHAASAQRHVDQQGVLAACDDRPEERETVYTNREQHRSWNHGQESRVLAARGHKGPEAKACAASKACHGGCRGAPSDFYRP